MPNKHYFFFPSLPCSYLCPTMILNIYVRNSSLFIYFLQFRNKISSTLILLSAPCLVSNVVHLPHLTLAAHSRSWSYSWRFQSGYCPQRCDVGPPPGHWKWEDLWQPTSQPHPRTTHWRWDVPQNVAIWRPGILSRTPGWCSSHWTNQAWCYWEDQRRLNLFSIYNFFLISLKMSQLNL